MLSAGGIGAPALFIRMEYARDLNNLLDEMFCARIVRAITDARSWECSNIVRYAKPGRVFPLFLLLYEIR